MPNLIFQQIRSLVSDSKVCTKQSSTGHTMNDLSTRVRDYLDRKKPDRPKAVTPDVTSEVAPDELTQAWTEWKDYFKTPIFIGKCVVVFASVVLVLWAMAIVDIQNECYLNKECREWVENR